MDCVRVPGSQVGRAVASFNDAIFILYCHVKDEDNEKSLKPSFGSLEGFPVCWVNHPTDEAMAQCCRISTGWRGQHCPIALVREDSAMEHGKEQQDERLQFLPLLRQEPSLGNGLLPQVWESYRAA